MKFTYVSFVCLALCSATAALFLPKPVGAFTRRAAIGAGAAVAAGGLAVVIKQQQDKKAVPPFTPAPGSLQGQTILITGGTSGLGLESAKRLASGGAQVIVTSRSASKGEQAITAVQEYLKERGLTTAEDISYRILDLDDLQSVRATVEGWKNDEKLKKIDVLMNNAGIMALPNRELTTDGIERQMQSNHLGHFLLTALLAKQGQLANDARIVNVSSEAHKFASRSGMDLDYAWKADTPSGSYGAWKSYGQSKLANILFTKELQKRIDSSPNVNWTAVSLHPGAVATDLGRNLFGPENYEKLKAGEAGIVQTTIAKTLNYFIKTVEDGATTQVWLADKNSQGKADVSGVAIRGGEYLSDCKIQKLGDFATDMNAAARLWKDSEDLAGVSFEV